MLESSDLGLGVNHCEPHMDHDQEVDQSYNYQIWIIWNGVSLLHWEAITTAATESLPASHLPASQPASVILQNNHVPHSFRHIIQSPWAATSLNSRIANVRPSIPSQQRTLLAAATFIQLINQWIKACMDQ